MPPGSRSHDSGPAAHENVVIALQRDAARHVSRVDGVARCQADDNLDPSDEEDQKKDRFSQASRRLICIQKLSPGIRQRHAKQVHGHGLGKSQEGELFLGKLLNYVPLMARVTKEMQTFHAPLFGEDGGLDKTRLFGLICQAFHEIRKFTIMAAWSQHVKPMQDAFSEAVRKYDSLKTQFKEARTTYLKEMSELRDKARVRGDPIDGLNMDVTYWFEPTQCIEPEERKFLLAVMREKFKMMMENDPRVVSTFDLSQFNKMMEQAESHECQQLRDSLKKKDEQLFQLRQALSTDEPNRPGGRSSGQPGAAHGELVIQALEMQMEQLRNKKDEVDSQLHAAHKKSEHLEIERDELAAELRSESSVRCMLQEECEQLRMKHDQSEEARTTLEQKADSLSQTLSEREETTTSLTNKVQSLSNTLQRTARRRRELRSETLHEQPENIVLDLDENVLFGGSENSDVCTQASGDHLFCNALDKEDDNMFFGESENSEVSTKYAGEETDATTAETNAPGSPPVHVEERNEVAQLQSTVAKLQDLLRMHVEGQSRSQAENAAEEVQDLMLVVQSLGCGESSMIDFKVADGTRVCRCGNVLMEDSKFCRKCGQEWKSPDQQSPSQVIAALSIQLERVAGQLEEAIDDLHNELEHKEDPARDQRIAECERKVTRLKTVKKGFETQLIVERSVQSFQDIDSLLQTETCTCNCFQQLEITKDMLKQVQGVCAEIMVKLKEATDDNLQLNSALDSTLASMRTATKWIARCKTKQGFEEDEDLSKGAHALSEAEHSAVFHRLFNPNSDAKNKWKDWKQKLMEASAEAIRPMLVMDTSSHEVPAVAPTQPPTKRPNFPPGGVRKVALSKPSAAHQSPRVAADRMATKCDQKDAAPGDGEAAKDKPVAAIKATYTMDPLPVRISSVSSGGPGKKAKPLSVKSPRHESPSGEEEEDMDICPADLAVVGHANTPKVANRLERELGKLFGKRHRPDPLDTVMIRQCSNESTNTGDSDYQVFDGLSASSGAGPISAKNATWLTSTNSTITADSSSLPLPTSRASPRSRQAEPPAAAKSGNCLELQVSNAPGFSEHKPSSPRTTPRSSRNSSPHHVPRRSSLGGLSGNSTLLPRMLPEPNLRMPVTPKSRRHST